MPRIAVPYRATGRFSPLALDYLDAAPALREFYRWSADADGLHAAMQARVFRPATRTTLCDAFERQYAHMEVRPEVRANLDRLRRSDTLTVTTGHQLCLFTGPLYVPFKIIDVIRLARELSTAQREVVPVFWMATEDHDRAEIDHTWINSVKVQWPGEAAGAVGRLKLEGIGPVLDQVDALLGPGSHADEMRELLRRCYRPEYGLAKATRLFVDALFGRFGLLILDADDPALKAVFAPLMREELLNQVAERSVHYADAKLAAHYSVQAHARDINLFYLRPGQRSRIERRDGHYQVLDGGPSFTLDQLLAELERHPEDFSPNVLLRPVYQEAILPNITYVGGGGELAYWFQLKWLFQALQVPMPVLLLRTSAAFLGEKDAKRLSGLGLTLEQVFGPVAELEAELAKRNASFDTGLDSERKRSDLLYAGLTARAKAADPTLERAVAAIAKRAANGLDALERKLVRAAKREQEEKLEQLHRVHEHLFPGGGLQERRDNFIPYYLSEGPAFFDRLLAELDPLDARFKVLQG
jgi:bacillithiol biosynthesis cysteine-adding enzyme BshC